jgi:hypothetical protein
MDIERKIGEILWHEDFEELLLRVCAAAHRAGVTRADIVKALILAQHVWSRAGADAG